MTTVEVFPSMQQSESEFELLLRILEEHDPPQRILEIGCFAGGTITRFRHRFPDATIVGVDPSPCFAIEPLGCTIILGESQHELTRRQALEALGGIPDFVFIDGDHSEKMCAADLAWCRAIGVPMIALHDLTLRNHPQLEVWKVWDQLKNEVDPSELREIQHVSDAWGIGVWDRRRVTDAGAE